MVVELGGQVIQTKNTNIPEAILEQAIKKDATTVCIGMPYISIWRLVLHIGRYKNMLNEMKSKNIDLIILS